MQHYPDSQEENATDKVYHRTHQMQRTNDPEICSKDKQSSPWSCWLLGIYAEEALLIFNIFHEFGAC